MIFINSSDPVSAVEKALDAPGTLIIRYFDVKATHVA